VALSRRSTVGKFLVVFLGRSPQRHVKALLSKKRAQGLSKNSVRLSRATLSVMLGDAIDDMISSANPALGIKIFGPSTRLT
jgi:hypothetical protein